MSGQADRITVSRAPDAIDEAARLTPGGAVFELRAARPDYIEGAEACRTATLKPRVDLGLDPALRQAVARRVALRSGSKALVAQLPCPAPPGLALLAEGRDPDDPRLAAIAAHADMIASAPGRATREDLTRLLAVGLSVPQIVALSELLAFVCFQVRVVHGLGLLEIGR